MDENLSFTYMSFFTSASSYLRPIRRLVAYSVFLELVTACRRAGIPTSLSSSLVNATTDGVVLAPSLFSSTFGVLPSIAATHEFVVPRSIPMTWPLTLSELQTTLKHYLLSSTTKTKIKCYRIHSKRPKNMSKTNLLITCF